MMHKGVEYHGSGDGRAEHLEVAIPDRRDRQNRQDGNEDDLLAIRRVQLRIDRELRGQPDSVVLRSGRVAV